MSSLLFFASCKSVQDSEQFPPESDIDLISKVNSKTKVWTIFERNMQGNYNICVCEKENDRPIRVNGLLLQCVGR